MQIAEPPTNAIAITKTRHSRIPAECDEYESSMEWVCDIACGTINNDAAVKFVPNAFGAVTLPMRRADVTQATIPLDVS
jgi:hypothetical protein